MTDSLDEIYWNGRYLDNTSAWDLGSISTPLKTYFDQLTNKNLKVLIPGAGNSYEAEYLVKNGFTNVFVCDFAAEPLKNLKQRCPQIKSENLLHSDFFKLEESNFDLIAEQTFFCALNPSLRQNYFQKMYELLKPGGKLVGVLFNDTSFVNSPPFGGTKEEYKTYFENLFKINVYDTCYNSIAPRANRELFINLEKV